jgi:hypothetical protein
MGIGPTGVAGADPRRDETAIGFGLAFAGLVAVSLWASLVASAVEHVSGWVGGAVEPLVLVSGVTSVVGFVLGSVAYARHRGFEFGLSLPRRGTRRTAARVVLAPAVLTAGTALVGNALFGVTLSSMTGRWISPEARVGVLLAAVVLPAAFLGLGYGFLFCGVAYERVHELVVPEHAVVVAATLAGFFRLLPVDAARALPYSLGGAVELLLSLTFGVAFGAGLGVLYRRAGRSPAASLERRHLFVLAVATLGVVGVATDLADLPGAVGDLLWVLVLGVAVLGYGRTRSVWVPVLSITVFQVALAGVVYAEALLGLAAGP